MIIIDYREKYLIDKLNEKNIKFELEKLDIGDIIVGNIIIERKTSEDLEASIIDGRFFNQLKKLKENHNNILLLIEGNKFYRLNKNAIRGALLSAVLDFDVKIIQSRDLEETCEIIKIIEKKQNKETKNIKLVNVKKTSDPKKIKLAMLSCLPGISYKKANVILEHFGTIKNFVNSLNKIDKLDGIGKKTKEKIIDIIEN